MAGCGAALNRHLCLRGAGESERGWHGSGTDPVHHHDTDVQLDAIGARSWAARASAAAAATSGPLRGTRSHRSPVGDADTDSYLAPAGIRSGGGPDSDGTTAE